MFAIRRSKDLVIDAGVLHLCENTSDQEVTYAKIEVSGEIVKVGHETVNPRQKLDWRAASNDQKLEYEDILFRNLNSMNIPESVTTCSDVKCNDDNHKKQIDEYVSK